MRKAITFVGTNNYTSTTYCMGDRCSTTPYFQVALQHFYQPECMLVVMTKEAHTKHSSALKAELPPDSYTEVLIPSGKNEDEIWQIFHLLIEQIGPEDTLIFDITNAFRSIPLVALSVAHFARTLYHAEVEALVYGAFDATQEGKTPVFNLTPFVQLLDWTSATQQFLETGSSINLSSMIKKGAASIPTSNQDGFKLRMAWQQLAELLGELSQALARSRPTESIDLATKLVKQISAIKNKATPALQPFELLLDRLDSRLQPISRKPEEPDQARGDLRCQAALVQWYLDYGQIIQAVTLARELIVSRVIVEHGKDMFEKPARNEAEKLLNSNDPSIASLRATWRDLADLRNDVAHAGMRKNRRGSDNVMRQAKALCQQLIDIP